MLTKMVNGKEEILSEQEERQQRAYWALNDAYPEYSGHCGWDGANEPFHNMEECKKHHKKLLKDAYELAKSVINVKIEMAEEEVNNEMLKSAIEQRKELRKHLDSTFDHCKTVDDLKASIPEILKPYWNV